MTKTPLAARAAAEAHTVDSTPRRRWAAVAALATSTFLVVTAEMLPVGVLTPMADGLGISTGAAGLSLTITGLVSAVTAPVVPRLLGDADRRHVLAVAMVLLAAGNAITTAAHGFWSLVAGRVILGVGMGVVWGLASAVATRLVAGRHVSLAVSLVVSGVASASVLGVPLGTVIGEAWGWRSAFAVAAVASVATGLALLRVLPPVRRPPAQQAEGRGRRSLLRPAVVAGLALIALLVVGHFTAYTFVRPILEDRAGLSVGAIAVLLLAYGVLGLLGNFAAGAAAGRRPRATAVALAAGIALSLTVLALFGRDAFSASAAIALWGVSYGGVSVGGQMWMTAAAPDRLEHATGLYVGVFTAAIAVGALAGGSVIESSSTTVLLWTATGLATAALAVGLVGPAPRSQ